MEELTWSDRIGSRGRGNHLWLRSHEGKLYEFTGENIPQIVSVRGSSYHKEGKWSNTTYRLVLAPGVRAFAFRRGWQTGTIREGLAASLGWQSIDTWAEFANALSIGMSEAKKFLAQWPRAAEHYDRVEESLCGLEEVSVKSDFVISVCSFGGPTNRQIDEGFWQKPLVVTDEGGEERGVVFQGDDGVYVSQVKEVAVIDVIRHPGYHGGTHEVKVAMPVGWYIKKMRS